MGHGRHASAGAGNRHNSFFVNQRTHESIKAANTTTATDRWGLNRQTMMAHDEPNTRAILNDAIPSPSIEFTLEKIRHLLLSPIHARNDGDKMATGVQSTDGLQTGCMGYARLRGRMIRRRS